MSERVQYDRSDSDVTLFFSLLLYGEYVLKLVVAAMVATIQTDRDRSRYSALYELVRADGLGVWTDVLDTILVGPPSRRLYPAARPAQKQLTQKSRTDWPVEAFELLNRCMEALDITVTSVSKPSVRDWFRSFTVLRNKDSWARRTQGRAMRSRKPLARALDCVARRPTTGLPISVGVLAP